MCAAKSLDDNVDNGRAWQNANVPLARWMTDPSGHQASRCDLEMLEQKAWSDGATHQRIFTEAFCCLPRMGWNHDLRGLSLVDCRTKDICALSDRQLQGCTGIEMPDLGSIHAVQARALPLFEQVIDRGRMRTARIGVAKGFAIVTPFGMRLQIKPSNQPVGLG